MREANPGLTPADIKTILACLSAHPALGQEIALHVDGQKRRARRIEGVRQTLPTGH